MGRAFLFAAMVACLSLILFCACAKDSGDDDDSSSDDDSDPASDDAGDDGTDAVSSASPGKNANLLSESHSGWKKAECYDCHNDVHQGAFALGECVTCHGSNGATRRTAGHANADCRSCHADEHAASDFLEQHCAACHKYESGVECPVTEDYDVVVIGAGGGGLAAADILSQAGLKVALVEKHYKVGGYMTTFHRGDYTFEASLHAMDGLDAPQNSKSVTDFMRLGIYNRIEPLKSDPMYRAIFPTFSMDVPSDMTEYKNALKEMFPDEADGIDALFADMVTCDVVLTALSSMKSDFTFDALWTVLSNISGAVRLLRYLDMSLLEMASQYISDPNLLGLWMQLVTFLGDGPSNLQAVFFMAMWSGYHERGYYYITGGSRSVSEAMADIIRENGGVIKLNTLATKIVIEDGRAVQVRTKDDACLNTRYVVSNANAPSTLLDMIGEEYLPSDYVKRIKTMTLGAATLQVFLGVNKDFTSLFPGTHEIMINETVDQDESFGYIQSGNLDKVPIIIADYTVVDPTNAPAGKNSISLTTYMPYDWQQAWNWGKGYEQYKNFKTDAANVLIARAEKYLPGLSDSIEVMEVGTPVTNYAFSLNPGGTIFGWANTPEQATLHRIQSQTPIDNVLLAGAWTFPGGGQSAVIDSGCTAADAVLAKEESRK
jgi:all-trans-retinol 13,14-reductase